MYAGAGTSRIRVDSSAKNPFTGDPEAIVLGEVIYTGQCAARCHPTESGWAGGKYPDLLDCEWPRGGSDVEIFQTVMDGVSKTEMLGWKGKLTDDAVWQVLAYLRAESACGVTRSVTTAQAGDPPRVVAKIETQTAGQNPFSGNAAAILMGRLAFRGQCAAECHPGAGAWTGGKYPNLFDCE